MLGGNPCVCKAHWDGYHDGYYQESCANQRGCTDCDESGYTWCEPTNPECDTVERLENGDSSNWFRCNKGKKIHLLADIDFESIIYIYMLILDIFV